VPCIELALPLLNRIYGTFYEIMVQKGEPEESTEFKVRAMAHAVSRRPPTAKARDRSRLSPRGICGGQIGTGTGFSPSTSVFHCQFHSPGAPSL
jgi:hypothetical protein